MNVAARAAVETDASAIAVIAEAIREELAPLRGGAVLLAQQDSRAMRRSGEVTAAEPSDTALKTALTAVSTAAFVGTIDDVVVGLATVSVEELLDGSRLGVIHELGVLVGARGVGVGEAMLDEVLVFCRHERCRGIDSYALPGTRETKNFFETFGFTARLLVVHTNLTDEPGRPDEAGHPGLASPASERP